MSPTALYKPSVEAAGVSISGIILRTGDGANGWEIALPVGYAGTLTTRTDNDTGTVTLAAGHGITTGMIVDIHWAGGVQFGVTVGTVSVNSMPFDGGTATSSGAILPIATTTVVVTQRVNANVAFDGDRAKLVALSLETTEGTTGKAHVAMYDATNTLVESERLVGSEPQINDVQTLVAQNSDNPFTGAPIVVAKCSNGSSATAATLKIIVIEDATP